MSRSGRRCEEREESFVSGRCGGDLPISHSGTGRRQDRDVVGIGVGVDSSSHWRGFGCKGAFCGSVCHHRLVLSLPQGRYVGQGAGRQGVDEVEQARMKSCSPLSDTFRTVLPRQKVGRIRRAVSHLRSHTLGREDISMINVAIPCTSPPRGRSAPRTCRGPVDAIRLSR